MSQTSHCLKKLNYLCNWMSQIRMSATQFKVIVFKPWKSCITMKMAALIGWFSATIALILREKQFQYCLTNTKRFTFIHLVGIYWIDFSKNTGIKMRTDKTRTKLTDTTPITPTSIHTNKTIKASKQGVLERIFPLKQLPWNWSLENIMP